MALFERSPRPDCTVEGHGVITRLGLFAHGVQSNPLVGPASYLSHSGTYTEAGQKHLEEMCQAWTRKSVQYAIDEENGLHDIGPPITKRKACATPLASLLAEIEKGRMPSDVLPTSFYKEAIGVPNSFNIQSTDTTPARLTERMMRCSTRERGRDRETQGQRRRTRSAPAKNRRAKSIERGGHTQGFADALVAEARAVARAANEAEQELSLTEKAFLDQSLQKASRAIYATRQPSSPRSRRMREMVTHDSSFNGQDDVRSIHLHRHTVDDESDQGDSDSQGSEDNEEDEDSESFTDLPVPPSRSQMQGSRKHSFASKERALKQRIADLDAQLYELQSSLSSSSSASADDEYSITSDDVEASSSPSQNSSESKSHSHKGLAGRAPQRKSKSQRFVISNPDLAELQDGEIHLVLKPKLPKKSSPRATSRSQSFRSRSEYDMEETKDDEDDDVTHGTEYLIQSSRKGIQSPRDNKRKEQQQKLRAKSMSPVVNAVRDIMAELSLSPRSMRKSPSIY